MSDIGGVLYLHVRDKTNVEIEAGLGDSHWLQLGDVGGAAGPAVCLAMSEATLGRVHAALGSYLEERSRGRRAAQMIPIIGPRIEVEQ